MDARIINKTLDYKLYIIAEGSMVFLLNALDNASLYFTMVKVVNLLRDSACRGNKKGRTKI